jgi:hypothetical protein
MDAQSAQSVHPRASGHERRGAYLSHEMQRIRLTEQVSRDDLHEYLRLGDPLDNPEVRHAWEDAQYSAREEGAE